MQVKLRGEWADDDGWEQDLGPVPPGMAWWDVPTPPCPDCGGTMIRAEAGHTPGARRCAGPPINEPDELGSPQWFNPENGCGSYFSVKAYNGTVVVRRLRFY